MHVLFSTLLSAQKVPWNDNCQQVQRSIAAKPLSQTKQLLARFAIIYIACNICRRWPWRPGADRGIRIRIRSGFVHIRICMARYSERLARAMYTLAIATNCMLNAGHGIDITVPHDQNSK